jgi:hypothetical protein
MKFVCSSSDDVMKITLILNPVTGTEIKLNPPYVWDSREQLDTFVRNVELYCQVTWHFGRLDPTEVNTSRWPDTLPPGFADVPGVPDAPVDKDSA